MKISQIDKKNFLVEWKYKDFLKLGNEFRSAEIVKLERYEFMGKVYAKVTVDKNVD